MMNNSLFLLVLLFVAVAIGWVLGRSSVRKKMKPIIKEKSGQSKSYLEGVNFLMHDRPDRAVDIFLQSLPVTSETLDTYISLGSLLRRNGEVEKAVKVHQHLLVHHQVGELGQQLAQLELARDYHAAGLLDRAENILQDMVERNSTYRQECLLLLVDIYRDEREWEKALHAASLLRKPRFSLQGLQGPKKEDIELATAQTHFCCELAEAAFKQNDFLTARRWIKQAFQYDKTSVRASLIWAQLQFAKQQYQDSIKIVKKIIKQHQDFTPEVLDLLTASYKELGDYKGYQKFLLQCFAEVDSVSLMLQIAENIQLTEGQHSALQFVAEQLGKKPSLRGIQRLVEMQTASLDIDTTENNSGAYLDEQPENNMLLIKTILEKILSRNPAYRCSHCGFSGKKLHWLCPSCKTWESVHLIQGLEGE